MERVVIDVSAMKMGAHVTMSVELESEEFGYVWIRFTHKFWSAVVTLKRPDGRMDRGVPSKNLKGEKKTSIQ